MRTINGGFDGVFVNDCSLLIFTYFISLIFDFALFKFNSFGFTYNGAKANSFGSK